ncbi:TonB family protein [Chitinimonas arctica]|uniref:Protein TonB n=1 Tax=Chitinimonas arctica TaxID=2594795 RepID=A0A516SHK5_9NEIS|nr:TonB family protein [Chitinimonas arctica]QDQ27636.1 TonB family protein [Chitinimonas arctica]
MSSPNLLAVYVRTSAGEGELASPTNGLSINQRKLLQWCDGQLTVMEMAERLATGHSVDAEHVARDMEKLEKLSLLKPLGAGINVATPLNATFQPKKRLPWWLVGTGAVVVVGGLVAFSQQAEPVQATSQVGAPGAQARLAPEETEQQIFGVMPNPARWFSPGQKPEPKPVEEKVAETKPVPVAPKAADPKLAQAAAAVAKPVPAPVPVPAPAAITPTTAPAPLAVEPVPKPEPVVPVQVASAQPILARPEPPPPNRKPIHREQPEFPREATRDGIETGRVRARMTVNEAGQVVKVDILESKPRKVFDRAVLAALTKWRFQQAAAGFTVDTEVDFRDN